MFEQLLSVNVNDHVEKKSGLSYLSWAPAWAEFKKLCPDATYDIKKFNNNLPYVYDENTGYMVFTSITANGETHEMWLPVMDNMNRAMKSSVYQVYKKDVQPATMFDINKTIMRCLVKNMAMFGLGLYIYAGEDLPEGEQPEEQPEEQQQEKPQQVKKPTESGHKKEHDRIMAEIKGKWNTLSAITKTHTDDKERDAALEAWIEKMVSEKSASYTDINAILAKLLKDATDKQKKEKAG